MSPTERKAAYRAKHNAENAARNAPWPPVKSPRKARPAREPRPVYGSQQWAETYRDDLGESHD